MPYIASDSRPTTAEREPMGACEECGCHIRMDSDKRTCAGCLSLSREIKKITLRASYAAKTKATADRMNYERVRAAKLIADHAASQ